MGGRSPGARRRRRPEGLARNRGLGRSTDLIQPVTAPGPMEARGEPPRRRPEGRARDRGLGRSTDLIQPVTAPGPMEARGEPPRRRPEGLARNRAGRRISFDPRGPSAAAHDGRARKTRPSPIDETSFFR